MRILPWALLASLVLLAPEPAMPASPFPMHGQATPNPDQVPQPPIQDLGLHTLRSLVTTNTFKQLGFNSVAEARLASLGVPAPRYFVSLLSLQQYTAAMSPQMLLFDRGSTVFPVNVVNIVRSSITFVRRGLVWKAEMFGSPLFIQRFDSARRADMQRTNTPVDVYYVVDIPAMQRSFLGVSTSNGLFLIPIVSEPNLGFTAGVRLPAQVVFLKLAPLAKQMGSSPPPS